MSAHGKGCADKQVKWGCYRPSVFVITFGKFRPALGKRLLQSIQQRLLLRRIVRYKPLAATLVKYMRQPSTKSPLVPFISVAQHNYAQIVITLVCGRLDNKVFPQFHTILPLTDDTAGGVFTKIDCDWAICHFAVFPCNLRRPISQDILFHAQHLSRIFDSNRGRNGTLSKTEPQKVKISCPPIPQLAIRAFGQIDTLLRGRSLLRHNTPLLLNTLLNLLDLFVQIGIVLFQAELLRC